MDRRKKREKKSETSAKTPSRKIKVDSKASKTKPSTKRSLRISFFSSFDRVDWSLNPLVRTGIFLVFFLFTWWFFGVRYGNLLYVAGVQEGFYLEWQTLTGCLAYIALPLELVVSLLMQSFLFPVVGGLVIAVLASGLILFAAKRISSGPWGMVLAVTISLFLYYVMIAQGYYLFGYRSFVFFLQALVGLFLAFALAAGYARCPRGTGRIVYAICSVVLCYPLIGSFVLCTALYELKTELDEIRTEGNDKAGRVFHEQRALLLTFLTFLTPWFWYPLYSGTIPVCMLYAHNFCYREITLVDLGTIMLNRVFGGVLVFLLLLPVIVETAKFLHDRRKGNRETLSLESSESTIPVGAIAETIAHTVNDVELKTNTVQTQIASTEQAVTSDQFRGKSFPLGNILTILLVCCLSVSTVVFANHDDRLMTSFALWRPFENRQWDKIIELEGKLNPPLLPLIELRRQAQLETGQLTQHYFERNISFEISDDLIEISSFQIYGMELLILNGNINHGYRMAMNYFQFRRNQSPRLLKILFMGAIVNEEYPLAKRYLDRLKKIPFRKQWCKNWERVLDYCSQHKDSDELEGVSGQWAHDAKRVFLMRSLRPDQDYLGGNDRHYYPCVTYAARFRNIKALPRPWQEQQLLHVLVLRDFKSFRSNFSIYHKGLVRDGITEIPDVIQMGLLYCHFIDTGRCESPPEYKCSSANIVKFRDYALHMSHYEQTHDKALLEWIGKHYSNTCWYAVDFGQDLILY